MAENLVTKILCVCVVTVQHWQRPCKMAHWFCVGSRQWRTKCTLRSQDNVRSVVTGLLDQQPRNIGQPSGRGRRFCSSPNCPDRL
jgi:hypothetical protein